MINEGELLRNNHHSRLRMCPIVDLDKFFHRDLRIDLRGRKSCVAEEFLDVTEVSTAIQKMCRERVPQAVRRDIVDIGTLNDVFIDHPADTPGGDTAPAAVEKHSLLVTLGRRAFV